MKVIVAPEELNCYLRETDTFRGYSHLRLVKLPSGGASTDYRGMLRQVGTGSCLSLVPSIFPPQERIILTLSVFSLLARRLRGDLLTLCKYLHRKTVFNRIGLFHLSDKGITRSSDWKSKPDRFKLKIRCKF